MKTTRKFTLWSGVSLLLAFILWTVLVRTVDVQPIGPLDSAVGLATVNRAVHRLTGVHTSLYVLTDWLGLVPIGVAVGFAILGLVQWIRRRNLWRVDQDILALGGFYLAVIAVYLLFELVSVNYRPVLIHGALETSYPSSTTMLAMCVMPTALLLLRARIHGGALRTLISVGISAFIVLMVVGRILSGVHWITDIIGGALISAGLVLIYASVAQVSKK